MVRRVRESVKTWGFHTRSCVKDAGKSDLKKLFFVPGPPFFFAPNLPRRTALKPRLSKLPVTNFMRMESMPIK